MALSMSSASLVAKEASFLSFSGLRASAKATTKVHANGATCTCASCKRLVVSASATSHSSAGQSLVASVSQTTAPPAPASSSGASLLPVVVGAGALGVAAYIAVKKVAVPAAEPSKGGPNPPSGIVPRATRAAPSAIATMATTFPNSMQEEAFFKSVAAELAKFGFRRDNCIALVNTCRDEVCRPVVSQIDREFGLSFNISGLGGLVNCGKTGFKAAMSHSPEFPCETDGSIKERYIFFAFPHVSIGESGEVGSLLRRGRGKPSNACGALIAIKNDINKGGAVSPDADDAEYVLLKKKVMAKVAKKDGDVSLVQVTKAAMQAINDDIEKLISLTVDPKTADYAVITGVQIHSGNQIPGEEFRIERTCDYIAPDRMYAVVRGQRTELTLAANKADLVTV
jgi:hypothetical protein